MLCLFLIYSCKKDVRHTRTVSNVDHQDIKQAFLQDPASKLLLKRYNDTLNTVWTPDWESVAGKRKNDTVTVFTIPLTASLQSSNAGTSHPLRELNYRKYLVASKHGQSFLFSVTTVLNEDTAVASGRSTSKGRKVLFEESNKKHKIVSFDKSGWLAAESDAGAKTNAEAGTMACTYVCNWGYYCLSIGYTATVAMSEDGCVMPPPPGPCPPSGTIADETAQSKFPQLYFGLPWYSVDDLLIFTRTDAQRMAADALNWGEYRMRRRFKSNPNLTEAQLAEIWITEMNNEMTKISRGFGRISRTGSLNPAVAVPQKV